MFVNLGSHVLCLEKITRLEYDEGRKAWFVFMDNASIYACTITQEQYEVLNRTHLKTVKV